MASLWTWPHVPGVQIHGHLTSAAILERHMELHRPSSLQRQRPNSIYMLPDALQYRWILRELPVGGT